MYLEQITLLNIFRNYVNLMRRINTITIKNTLQKLSQDSRENGVETSIHIITHTYAITGEIVFKLYLIKSLKIFKNVSSTRDT
jgi:hypothetical protein